MTNRGNTQNLNTVVPALPFSSPYNKVLHLECGLYSTLCYLHNFIRPGSPEWEVQVWQMEFETKKLTEGLIEVLSNIDNVVRTTTVTAAASYYAVICEVVNSMFTRGYLDMNADSFGYMDNAHSSYHKQVCSWFVDFRRLMLENSRNGDKGQFQFALVCTTNAGKYAVELKARLETYLNAAKVRTSE
jgi:hypothetical protein